MEAQFKTVQSNQKPSEIDVSSSPYGVYYNRNIKPIEKTEQPGETVIVWEYEQAFMSLNEWEEYQMTVLAKKLNDEDNSAEFEEFSQKMRTGVPYTNGKYYKPIWHKLYSSIIDEFEPKINLYNLAGGDVSQFLGIRTNIYDITGKAANVVQMNIKEVIELWVMLYQKKEEYYNEYKAAREAKGDILTD